MQTNSKIYNTCIPKSYQNQQNKKLVKRSLNINTINYNNYSNKNNIYNDNNFQKSPSIKQLVNRDNKVYSKVISSSSSKNKSKIRINKEFSSALSSAAKSQKSKLIFSERNNINIINNINNINNFTLTNNYCSTSKEKQKHIDTTPDRQIIKDISKQNLYTMENKLIYNKINRCKNYLDDDNYYDNIYYNSNTNQMNNIQPNIVKCKRKNNIINNITERRINNVTSDINIDKNLLKMINNYTDRTPNKMNATKKQNEEKNKKKNLYEKINNLNYKLITKNKEINKFIIKNNELENKNKDIDENIKNIQCQLESINYLKDYSDKIINIEREINTKNIEINKLNDKINLINDCYINDNYKKIITQNFDLAKKRKLLIDYIEKLTKGNNELKNNYENIIENINNLKIKIDNKKKKENDSKLSMTSFSKISEIPNVNNESYTLTLNTCENISLMNKNTNNNEYNNYNLYCNTNHNNFINNYYFNNPPPCYSHKDNNNKCIFTDRNNYRNIYNENNNNNKPISNRTHENNNKYFSLKDEIEKEQFKEILNKNIPIKKRIIIKEHKEKEKIENKQITIDFNNTKLNVNPNYNLYTLSPNKDLIKFNINSKSFTIITNIKNKSSFEKNITKNIKYINTLNGLFILCGTDNNLLYYYSQNLNSYKFIIKLNENHLNCGILFNKPNNSLIFLSGERTNKVEEFIISSKTINYLPPMNYKRSNSSYCFINKKIYSFFGYNYNKDKFIDNIEVLNTEKLLKWKIKYLFNSNYFITNNNQLFFQKHLCINFNNSCVYLLGGISNNKVNDDIYIIDVDKYCIKKIENYKFNKNEEGEDNYDKAFLRFQYSNDFNIVFASNQFLGNGICNKYPFAIAIDDNNNVVCMDLFINFKLIIGNSTCTI